MAQPTVLHTATESNLFAVFTAANRFFTVITSRSTFSSFNSVRMALSKSALWGNCSFSLWGCNVKSPRVCNSCFSSSLKLKNFRLPDCDLTDRTRSLPPLDSILAGVALRVALVQLHPGGLVFCAVAITKGIAEIYLGLKAKTQWGCKGQ